MKHIHPRSLLLLLPLLLLSTVTRLQAAQPYRTDTNPALLYWQLFTLLPNQTDPDRKLHDQRLTLPDTPDTAQAVNRYDSLFRLLRRAPGLKGTLDWGIDPADGPHTLLPHLAKAKSVAQAAQFRTRFLLEHNREKEAVQDLIATTVLGRHVSADSFLIGTLVAIAIDNIVYSTVQENFDRFSAEGLRSLMTGIDAAPPATTISQSINVGERSFTRWLIREIRAVEETHPNDETKRLKALREMLSSLVDEQDTSDKAESILKAAGGSTASMLAHAQDLEKLFDQLAALTALPHPECETRIEEFMATVASSKNGLARQFMPALGKSRDREIRSKARLEMLRAAVEFKARGEAGVRSVRDPFGTGPFRFRRFEFKGVDRGFELRSALTTKDNRPEVCVFVETPGPAFVLSGPQVGRAIEPK